MSSDRIIRRVAVLGLLGLAGCGFAPVHGSGTAAQGAFTFETDNSVAGFALRGQLLRRLGTADAPQFALKATLSLSERAAAITDEGDTARRNVMGRADWAVVRLATDQQIASGVVDAFTSYSATGSTVATQASQDAARDRLAVILADMIVTRVVVATR